MRTSDLTLVGGLIIWTGLLQPALPGISAPADAPKLPQAARTAVPQVGPDAVATLEQVGLFFSSGSPGNLTNPAAFKAYLLKKDPYADFLTREEYARFREMQQEHHTGIGLALERDRTGHILCYPDPGGPAARAGIASGDRLVAIDGESILGQALPTVVAMAADNTRPDLVVDIVRKDRTTRRLTIVRVTSNDPSVIESRHGGHSIVRIAYFTSSTRQELEFILTTLPPVPLILDLRGNRGGDLNAAIDCAMLFLRGGDTVVWVQGRQGTHPYNSSINGRPVGRIFLLQDAGTASAAEVFIAALTENDRAVSVGQKTYGKGTRQDLIELRSGAVLILTTGYLLTPTRKPIDGCGLAPEETVPGAHPGLGRYLKVVDRLSGERATSKGGLHCR